MPNHWTYKTFQKEDDLRQGDILFPDEGLRNIFGKVHKHFLDNKYVAFVVLTQSCDLVRRHNKSCSATHISLAVVRKLNSILHTLLENCCEKVCEETYTKESKQKAIELFQRVMNQNEQALGLFYLHTDSDVKISAPSVALLRVTISLRAEHYSILQESRSGRISDDYVPKLGWLVGNLYSRVGTADWVEQGDKETLENIIDEQLSGPKRESSLGQPLWIEKSWVDAAKAANLQIENLKKADVIKALSPYKPKEKKEKLIEAITDVLKDKLPDILAQYKRDPSEHVESWLELPLRRLGNHLRNNQSLSQILKKEL